MAKKWTLAVLLIIIPAHGYGQAVSATNGSANSVPVFSGATSLAPSGITSVGGLVGFGQPNPTAGLNLSGIAFISNRGVYHGDAPIHIYGAQGCCGRLTELDGLWWNGQAFNIMSSTDSEATEWYWAWGLAQNQFFVEPGVWAQTGPPFSVNSNGSVGVGTLAPRAALEIAVPGPRGIALTSAGATITFPDATVQKTAWNGTVLGGDYAEALQVAGDRAKYEPGEVVEFDSVQQGRPAQSIPSISPSLTRWGISCPTRTRSRARGAWRAGMTP